MATITITNIWLLLNTQLFPEGPFKNCNLWTVPSAEVMVTDDNESLLRSMKIDINNQYCCFDTVLSMTSCK